jgi:hypothetical protein
MDPKGPADKDEVDGRYSQATQPLVIFQKAVVTMLMID